MPDPSQLLIARVHGVAARSAELRAAAQELTDLLTRPSDVTIYSISGTVHPIPDLSREPQRAS